MKPITRDNVNEVKVGDYIKIEDNYGPPSYGPVLRITQNFILTKHLRISKLHLNGTATGTKYMIMTGILDEEDMAIMNQRKDNLLKIERIRVLLSKEEVKSDPVLVNAIYNLLQEKVKSVQDGGM